MGPFLGNDHRSLRPAERLERVFVQVHDRKNAAAVQQQFPCGKRFLVVQLAFCHDDAHHAPIGNPLDAPLQEKQLGSNALVRVESVRVLHLPVLRHLPDMADFEMRKNRGVLDARVMPCAKRGIRQNKMRLALSGPFRKKRRKAFEVGQAVVVNDAAVTVVAKHHVCLCDLHQLFRHIDAVQAGSNLAFLLFFGH